MNKIFMTVALFATVFLFGAMPMTVKAAPEEEEPEVVCICGEKCSEDHVNEECEVCAYDHTLCQATEPLRTVEYVDEEGNPIDKPEYGPLTPDGNLELVDDYGSLEAGGKQFITVVTKSGHYFYIIIDRDDKGNEKVHFLNKVDESDLLALMDEEEVKEYEEKIQALEESEVTEETEPEELVEEEGLFKFPSIKKEPAEKSETNTKKMLPTIAVVIVIAGVGVFFLLKKKKGNKPKKKMKDPDADYNEEDYLDSLPKDGDVDDYDIDVDDTDQDNQ